MRGPRRLQDLCGEWASEGAVPRPLTDQRLWPAGQALKNNLNHGFQCFA